MSVLSPHERWLETPLLGVLTRSDKELVIRLKMPSENREHPVSCPVSCLVLSVVSMRGKRFLLVIPSEDRTRLTPGFLALLLGSGESTAMLETPSKGGRLPSGGFPIAWSFRVGKEADRWQKHQIPSAISSERNSKWSSCSWKNRVFYTRTTIQCRGVVEWPPSVAANVRRSGAVAPLGSNRPSPKSFGIVDRDAASSGISVR